MYIPKPIYRRLWKVWYSRIYLRSPAWYATRAEVLRDNKFKCQMCKTGRLLQVHHVDYHGTPKMQVWHFLPFARYFIVDIDYKSSFAVLCEEHHKETHGL